MDETKIPPPDLAEAVPVTVQIEGDLQGETAGSAAQHFRRAAWQRILWWVSLAVMLPIGLGVLQMLALLVQAERVRGVLEEGLRTAQSPEVELGQFNQSFQRSPAGLENSSYQLEVTANDNFFATRGSKGIFQLNGGISLIGSYVLKTGDVVEAEWITPASELVPRWLGPRLPWVGPDEVHVRWQVTVGQE